jgi:CRP-like cAMP-binding protein
MLSCAQNETLNLPHPFDALEKIKIVKRYRHGEEICSSECMSDFWYRVVAGVAKRCATMPNGRQQIVDLLLPGDIFACPLKDHRDASINAAADGTELACYPRRRVEMLSNSDPRLAKLLGEIAFETVYRLQQQLLILGRTTALEKIAAFLLELSRRQTGGAADCVVLPFSRYDIADYLAISVETVSRSLTGLKQRRLISFTTTRAIKIIDRVGLEGCGDRLRAPRPSEHHPSRLSPGGTRSAMTARRIASASL